MADISRYRGDTAVDSFTVKDADGVALNVTGYTFTLTVDERLNPTNESTQIAQIEATLVDAAAGEIEFPWTEEDADQAPGTYYYDIQMEDAGGLISTLAKGSYIFSQDITK